MAITANPEDNLNALLAKIEKKQGIQLDASQFQFRFFHENSNPIETADRALNYKDESNLNCLDMRIPVKDLKLRELLLVNKFFLDSPTRKMPLNPLPSTTPNAINTKKEQAMYNSFGKADDDTKEEDILLNDITATTYKVFISGCKERNMRFIRRMSGG